MKPSERHIVFDWNSTLLDDIAYLHGATNHLLTLEEVEPVSLDFFRSHYDVPFRQLYYNLGLPDERVQRLIDRENSTFHDYYEPMALRDGLRDGATEILDHARTHGVKTYILSNHIVEPIRTQLRRLEIEHFFAEVLAYANRTTQFRDMTKGERLRRFRAEHGWSDHSAIIVGDSVEEIDIAREQDMVAVAITGGCVSEERLRDARPDYVIHSLHELQPILEKEGFVS